MLKGHGSEDLLLRKKGERDRRSTTERNVDSVSAMEQEALDERSLGARVADNIVLNAGQFWFVACHVVFFAVWLLLNCVGPARLRFDPFPCPILSLVVALEAIFLVLFILISENRSNLQAEKRNHLDLQINLLAEHENTKMLQMLQALCEHHGLVISKDPEIAELATRTEPQDVLRQLESNLPRIP